MIVADAPVVPLFHDRSYLLVKPYVKGFSTSPLLIPPLRLISISE